jgi:hypothetical protein
MESNTKIDNPLSGKDPKEIWKEILEKSIPRNKAAFLKEIESYIKGNASSDFSSEASI